MFWYKSGFLSIFNYKINHMTKIIYSFLLTILLLFSASAAIIDPNSTATPTNSSSNPTEIQYSDTFLVLNSTSTTITQQLNYSLYLLQTGNYIDPNSTLAAAVQRSYTNGTTQYHLYVYSIDASFNIQEYQAVVRLVSNDVYLLTQFFSYAISGNSTDSEPLAAPTYIVAPQAASINQVVNKLTLGYSLLSSDQFSSNQNINSLDKQLKNAFSLSGATLAYAAQKTTSSSQINYRVFYTMGSGSTFHIKIASATYNSDYKTLFIQSLVQIQIPSALIPQ